MRSRLWYLCRFTVALAALLCSTGVVRAGEPQWVEVRSPHFSVVTDAGEKRGREVAMRFEQMRAVFGALMVKANVNLPTPLQIVAFRNTKEMRQVAPLFNGKPTPVIGLFQPGTDRSFIMLDMSVEDPWVVVFHEYAHQLMNGNFKGEFAPWFEEGFAEYFSSIEVDGKEARVGKIPADAYLTLQRVGMMKISDLFKVRQNSSTYNESGDHQTTFYAESGMLMHYLYDNHLLDKAATYFDLEDRKHLLVEQAIQQAFGMSAQQFDKVLSNYIDGRRYKYYSIAAPASISSNSYIATPMSDAAGNTVLADMHLHLPDYQDRGVSEFQDILKSDPNNAAACRGLGYAYLQKQNFKQASHYFNRASQLDSKDPRVHYYNALLMQREGGFGPLKDLAAMTRELETSIALDPTFADAYALLAFAQSTAGDAATALATMQKALAISPRNQNYLFNLGNIYLANRQLDQALALLQSLQVTDDPELAARVAETLAQVKEIVERKAEYSEAEEAEPPTPPDKPSSYTAAPAPSTPAKFLTGMLTSSDCATPPSILLTIVSGGKTWKMKVPDKNHFILIGADEFSCLWSRKKVAVNYRETTAGEASVISLEIQ